MCNIRRLIIFLGIVITLFKISCKPQKSLQANDENRKYFEDLSYIRSSQIISNTDNEPEENLNIEKDDIGIELDSIISIIKLENCKSDEIWILYAPASGSCSHSNKTCL